MIVRRYTWAVKNKLYRSEDNVVLSGILGGLGEYFDVDPVLMRIGFVMFLVFTGVFPGIFIYFLALLLVPKRADYEYTVVE